MRAGFNEYMGEGTVLAHLPQEVILREPRQTTGFTSPQEFI